MKTKLFRKIVETHGSASLIVQTWRATSLLLLLLATAPAFADAPQDTDLLYVCAGKGYKLTSGRKATTSDNSPLTYTWYRDSGKGDGFQAIQDSNADSYTVSATANTTAGTYAYVRKVKSVKCAELPSNTYTIVVLKPNVPEIKVTAATVCQTVAASSVTFGIAEAANTTYTWTKLAGQQGTHSFNTSTYTVDGSISNSSATNTVTAAASVTYKIDGFDDKVCTSTTATAVSVTIHPYPTVNVTTTAPLTYCGSGSYELTVEVTVDSPNTVTSTSTITWYDAESGGSTKGSGAKYTTPELLKADTYNYYVGAVTAAGCVSDPVRKQVTVTVDMDEGTIQAEEF